MEQVFAPWRIEWIEREDRNERFDGCVFCELPREKADRENYLLARSEHAYVLLNNYPYSPGHAMVIPHVHTGRYQELEPESLLALNRLLQYTLEAMDDALEPDGYNVGYNLGHAAAGGSVPDHLHAHVVPRWEGDTNFMPVLGETKVLVEAILETYDRLHDAFATQETATATDSDSAVVVDLE